jgi:DNA-binding transcriptional LysR family regulator
LKEIPTPTEIANFIETYQVKHVSRSAIRLGITQPTLTQSLHKLEEKLGTPLFFRTKQGLIPTEEGNLFYVRARKLLDTWRDVGEKISNSRTSVEGKFRVGCHQSVGTFTLPKLFDNLNRQAPGIDIELYHDFSRKITEQIIAYQIDLGFVVNPIKHPDLVLKKIGEDRVEFWKKRDLNDVPKRIFADTRLKQIESLLGKTFHREFKNWALVQTSSLEVVREMTVTGQGVGILPGRVASLACDSLVTYLKSLPAFHDEIYLAYRKEVLSSQAGRELVRLAAIVLN